MHIPTGYMLMYYTHRHTHTRIVTATQDSLIHNILVNGLSGISILGIIYRHENH